MAQFVKLDTEKLTVLRQIDERLVSYNVEMTEVAGGTFWKAYTEAQIDGTEEFPWIDDWRDKSKLQQWYDPIDTKNPRLLKLAKELGSAWIRVSGTWANKTYYDFDGHCNGVVPEGFQSLLTKEQWLNLLDFVKDVNGKLLVSIANCPGIHSAHEPITFEQADLLFRTSKEYGVPISAAEFTNEPDLMDISGVPDGYTTADHARDHDLFGAWLRENYPECLFVGPCATAPHAPEEPMNENSVEALLGDYKSKMDVFSYHHYDGISERGAAMGGHWPYEACMSEKYLSLAAEVAKLYVPYRDRYVPGGQLWVTESGDAACGGNTWASTYADVLRTLNELDGFCTVTDGIIFHNTLAASDYGWLKSGTYDPRPNYFAVLLWTRLMGNTVYDSKIPVSEGAHVYCHCRKDGKPGFAYLVINNSQTAITTVELPKEAVCYTLAGRDGLRSRVMTLNGCDLVLGENDKLPDLSGRAASGTMELTPGTSAFFVL